MDRRWFDPETGHLLFDEHIAEMPSFQAIVSDDVVTQEELTEQAERVVNLLRRLQSRLKPEVQELVGEVLCELAVLNALHSKVQKSTQES